MSATMSGTKAKCANLTAIILGGLILVFSYALPDFSRAQEEKQPDREIGVRGFLDEDGDGFNDLMPDHDGDGVPDALDPDFRGHRPDSAFMHQHRYGDPDSGQTMRYMMGDRFMYMGQHGEPGMFGPGDSTGHGGMCGDSMGWGGHHGGMDPGDTTGHGGMDPDSMGGGGHHHPGPGKIGDEVKPGDVPIKDEPKGSSLFESAGERVIESSKGVKEEPKKR